MTNALEALEDFEGLDGDQFDDGLVMYEYEVESLFDELTWMAFGSRK